MRLPRIRIKQKPIRVRIAQMGFLLQILFSFNSPISFCISVKQLFGDHIPTNGAKIIVKISNNNVYFPLRINAVEFKGFYYFLKNYAFFFTLCRNGF